MRNPEPKFLDNIEEIKKLIQDQYSRYERNEIELRRMSKRFHPMMMEEILHMPLRNDKNYFGFLMSLSFFKNDFPWIYDLGKEVVEVLKSKSNKETKAEAIEEFKEVLEVTLGHPIIREMNGMRKENMMYIKELPYLLNRYLEKLI